MNLGRGSRGGSRGGRGRLWIFLALTALLVSISSSSAQTGAESGEEGTLLSPEKEKIADRIFNELIAPCCWTTTVATHGSGAAPRIQAEVRQMLSQGRTYQQILDHYVELYGERILAKPKRTGFNLAAYWGPYLGILLAAVVSVLSIRRSMRRRRQEAAAAGPARASSTGTRAAPGSDEEYRRRIEDELRRSS